MLEAGGWVGPQPWASTHPLKITASVACTRPEGDRGVQCEPRAAHTRTGLHRARGETTKAVERSHVPIKDRLRPRRGLQSSTAGQRLLEGVEAVQAVRRGDGCTGRGTPLVGASGAARVRAEVVPLHALAGQRRRAA
jgi:hypothetical protein